MGTSRKAARATRRSKTAIDQTDDQYNVIAFQPQKRKRWTLHDLTSIKAKTYNQGSFLEGWFSGNHVCAHGSAGTGKTFLACYAALATMLDGREGIQKIKIIRNAVATRDVGHLPGTLEEKQAVYETPYRDIFTELLGRSASYQDMKDAGKVEFALTSHVRGNTWDDTVVIIDEAQNLSFHEIDSVMTRLGDNSRVIIIGDTRQSDLRRRNDEKEGLSRAIAVMDRVGHTTMVQFNSDDIVRGGFVKAWIKAVEDTE